MKKFLYILIAAVALLGFASCTSNTPSATVKKAYACMQKNDIDGYMQYVEADEKTEALIGMFKEKLEQALESQGGLESYKVSDEQIDEDGETATVKVELTYGNGKTDTENVKLKKIDGKWKITN